MSDESFADLKDVELVYWLRVSFLYALAWKTKAWAKAKRYRDDKADYAEAVRRRTLYETMLGIAQTALQRGIKIPDAALAGMLDLAGWSGQRPLPRSRHERVRKAHDELYVLERRLDVLPSAERVGLGPGERDVLEALREAGEPLRAEDIAPAAGLAKEYVKQLLRPKNTLRGAGLVKRTPVGYVATVGKV
jgi:hypothetical protein